MSWILFFIACGVAWYFYSKAKDAESQADYFQKSSAEWKEKFYEVVSQVTKNK